MKKWLISVLMLGMIIGIAGSGWGVPRMINVQGRITPRPDNGRQIKFSIFDAFGGGTLLWKDKRFITEGAPGADQIQIDADGVFSIVLGPWDDDGIPMPEFLDDNFYLEIEAVGTRLEPRQRLVSVPFAITARNVRGGTVVAQSATWHGVRGESSGTGLSSGVTGANLSTEPDAGIGVSGLSRTFGIAGAGGRIGVSGFGGVDSLGVPTVTGVGVYGSGVTAGGHFESESGHGVRAENNSARNSTISAENTTNIAVFGNSLRSDSVVPPHAAMVPVGAVAGLGQGLVGVSGSSLNNHGVFGIASDNDYAGVAGFHDRSGIGVLADAGTAGTALQLLDGSIKINSSTGAGTAGSRKHTAVGVVEVEVEIGIDGYFEGEQSVYNSYANVNSIILVTVVGGLRHVAATVQRHDGSFEIFVRGTKISSFGVGVTADVPVAYMIIN